MIWQRAFAHQADVRGFSQVYGGYVNHRKSDVQNFVSDGISPYPDYKASGIEWLGIIPSHWDVKAARRDFDIQLGKMLQPTPNGPNDSEIPYFKAQHVNWEAVQTTGLPFMWAQPGDEVQYGVRNGDLLVCEGGEVGRAGVVLNPPDRAIIQNALHRVRSLGTSDIRLLMYLLQHIASQGWFDVLCNRATIAHFTSEKFGDLPIPVPPLSEQRAIAAFLDRETAKIDALVAKQGRLIELLQEKRSALISHAVTRGLDSDVPMKDSGVEWLGTIPAHWEVMRLKHASRIQGGFAFSTDSFSNEGIPVVRMNNIRRGVLALDNVVRIPEYKCYDAFALNAGDVIYGLSGSTGATGSLGNFAVVRKGDVPAQLNQRVARIRPRKVRVLREFVIGTLQTSVFYQQVLSFTTGTAQFNVSTNDIGNVVLALPPLPEQRAIAAFLDSETAKIDALVGKIREAINRLKELRTALISAAVTGKIDVREEAA